jgi:hypothetical protein
VKTDFMGAVELRPNVAEVRKTGSMLWVEGVGLCRPWSSWKRRFSANAQNIADIVLPSSRPASHFGERTQLWFSSPIRTAFGTGQ